MKLKAQVEPRPIPQVEPRPIPQVEVQEQAGRHVLLWAKEMAVALQ